VKSYFLAPIASRFAATAALDAALPGQREPWLLKSKDGDVVAYLDIVEKDAATGKRTIHADISGRHFNEDATVISVLGCLKAVLGGEITNDA
jgi:hypothetical protein